MYGPAREKPAQRHIGRSTGKSKRLTGGAFANFPDKSVVIKMKQRGSGDYASEDAFDRVYSQMGIEIRKRAVGENQADVQSNQRTAPSENEAHEPTDIAVFLHAVAIVDPDEREILHVVENFEERNANKNVRDAVIAVPPKGNGRDQQRRLYRVRPLAQVPHPAKMQDEKDRNCDCPPEHDLLEVMQ